MEVPQVPPRFTALEAVLHTKDSQPVNVIGVCTDYKSVTRSRGDDLTMTVDLHDPSWSDGHGLEIRFFYRDELHFPKVTSVGDIVILYNIKKVTTNRGTMVVSNKTTTWIVLEYESVRQSKCDKGSDIKFHIPVRQHPTTSPPSITLLEYAKAILALENQDNWKAPLISAPVAEQVPDGQRVQATIGRRQKFTLISDACVPSGMKGIFGDILCDIRRIWHSNLGDRCQLYVTDYTENRDLFNYENRERNEETGHDYGDQFGYVTNSNSTWPGPWGKMTMAVSCWPPHCNFVARDVEAGDYVYLRNVHITYDQNGTILEGHCRTDRFHQDKISVQVVKKSEAGKDEKFKDLLKRKREYEEHCKREGITFLRDAKPAQKRNKGENEDAAKTKSNSKTEKKRARRDTRKAQKATRAGAGAAIDTTSGTVGELAATNTIVRSNEIPIRITPISTILSPDTLERRTAAGNTYHLPFQNSCYKCRIRVVDFFPDNLEDFSAPVRESDYASLSDCESMLDVDIMPEADDMDVSTSVGDGGVVKWEWRFILLVEDAKPTPTPTDKGSAAAQAKQMELLVSGDDATYLLRQDACNLRRDKKALVRLKETLFHLWGDLQEQKEERAASKGEKGGAELVPRGRPFECFIKEYGIPARDEMGKQENDVKKWERMWRLCLTTIANA